LNFGGFYAQASWFLTGESRPYDSTAGDFKRLIPRRNFNFGKGSVKRQVPNDGQQSIRGIGEYEQ
jgi:phosphate-selective porin